MNHKGTTRLEITRLVLRRFVAADAQASLLGVVDKIDFDQLTFNTDDE